MAAVAPFPLSGMRSSSVMDFPLRGEANSPTDSILRAYEDRSDIASIPGSLASMMRKTTETGDIGQFSTGALAGMPRERSMGMSADQLPHHQARQLVHHNSKPWLVNRGVNRRPSEASFQDSSSITSRRDLERYGSRHRGPSSTTSSQRRAQSQARSQRNNFSPIYQQMSGPYPEPFRQRGPTDSRIPVPGQYHSDSNLRSYTSGAKSRIPRPPVPPLPFLPDSFRRTPGQSKNATSERPPIGQEYDPSLLSRTPSIASTVATSSQKARQKPSHFPYTGPNDSTSSGKHGHKQRYFRPPPEMQHGPSAFPRQTDLHGTEIQHWGLETKRMDSRSQKVPQDRSPQFWDYSEGYMDVVDMYANEPSPDQSFTSQRPEETQEAKSNIRNDKSKSSNREALKEHDAGILKEVEQSELESPQPMPSPRTMQKRLSAWNKDPSMADVVKQLQEREQANQEPEAEIKNTRQASIEHELPSAKGKVVPACLKRKQVPKTSFLHQQDGNIKSSSNKISQSDHIETMLRTQDTCGDFNKVYSEHKDSSLGMYDNSTHVKDGSPNLPYLIPFMQLSSQCAPSEPVLSPTNVVDTEVPRELGNLDQRQGRHAQEHQNLSLRSNIGGESIFSSPSPRENDRNHIRDHENPQSRKKSLETLGFVQDLPKPFVRANANVAHSSRVPEQHHDDRTGSEKYHFSQINLFKGINRPDSDTIPTAPRRPPPPFPPPPLPAFAFNSHELYSTNPNVPMRSSSRRLPELSDVTEESTFSSPLRSNYSVGLSAERSVWKAGGGSCVRHPPMAIAKKKIQSAKPRKHADEGSHSIIEQDFEEPEENSEASVTRMEDGFRKAFPIVEDAYDWSEHSEECEKQFKNNPSTSGPSGDDDEHPEIPMLKKELSESHTSPAPQLQINEVTPDPLRFESKHPSMMEAATQDMTSNELGARMFSKELDVVKRTARRANDSARLEIPEIRIIPPSPESLSIRSESKFEHQDSQRPLRKKISQSRLANSIRSLKKGNGEKELGADYSETLQGDLRYAADRAARKGSRCGTLRRMKLWFRKHTSLRGRLDYPLQGRTQSSSISASPESGLGLGSQFLQS